MKTLITSLLILAGAASLPAQAGSRGDQILGAAIGAAAGAAVGDSIGGRDGAVVGGAIGGLVGASVAGGNRDRYDGRRYDHRHDRRYVDYRRPAPVYGYSYRDDRRGPPPHAHGRGRGHGKHHHDRYCRH